MNKPFYKKWWFISILAAILLLIIISLFLPKPPGFEGKLAAQRVADSLKKCQSEQEIAMWYEYVKEQLTQLKDEEDIKAFNLELEKLVPQTEEKKEDNVLQLNWVINYFVDQFGEKTKDAYITTNPPIQGNFSNIATTNSALLVSFIISDSTDVALKLFEYAGNNPVKAISIDTYDVNIKDKDGQTYTLTAKNYDDRLTFDKKSSKTIHDILLKGGIVKFRIINSEYTTSEYKFDIDNADGYKETYNRLRLEESANK